MGIALNEKHVVETVLSLRKLASESLGDIQVRVRCSPPLVEVLFRDPAGFHVAGFTLSQQINCCGVMVSTQTFVHERYRGQKLAQDMMPLKHAIAKALGYSALAATVNVTGNPAEEHILLKCGWVKGFEFVNSRTKNTVAFFFKTL